MDIHKKMARINNSELANELVQGAKIQQNIDIIPNQLGQTVVPVMEVNPKLLKYCNVLNRTSSSTTGTTTVFSVPSGKDFYLCGISLNLTKSAACDLTNCYVQCSTPEVGLSRIIDYNCQTTTAADTTITRDFSVPIKLTPGTTIQVLKTFTAGAATFTVLYNGYTIDNPNA